MSPSSTNDLITVHGAPSWRIANESVEAFLTRDGGHLGPVTFRTTHGDIQPFAVAPWWNETLGPDAPEMLRCLRGDFFCAPFGGNASPWRNERHPPHGETASARWRPLSLAEKTPGRVSLEAELKLTVRPGRVLKSIQLRPDETNVYCRHTLQDMSGPMCLGHHAMLQFPNEEGAGRIALSPFRHGQVCPQPFEVAAQGGYSCLKTAATFKDLRKVPLATGGVADLTRYPSREGFEDLVMVSAARRPAIAWTTVAFPAQGYLWFGLKDPKVLASTVMWHSNGGRHYPPWNGRHRGVLGLEEITSYFHFGLAESAAENPISRRGIPTCLRLRRDRPLRIDYIIGVAPIPPDFDCVRTVRFIRDGIILEAVSGAAVEHRVDIGAISGTQQ
ncbi:MAG: hypothetical protein ACREIA_08955, partial [Opitutaceae bacterium]